MDAKTAEKGANWVGMDGIEIINQTDLNTDDIVRQLRQNPEVAALTRWAQGIASPLTREGGLFDRDKYVTPFNIYDQMNVAYQAAESDDVVSNVLESTEALAFGGMSVDCEDMDEEDVWNQIMEDMDLESRIREMWRELFIVSQVYVCTWWRQKSYKVRGRSKNGVQRKKSFDLKVPAGMTILDPMKVLPVGNLMFNQEQLVYIAVPGESQQFERILTEGLSDDTIVSQLITGRYEPSYHERVRITQLGLPADHLYFLNPKYVWRHTLTRPQYIRFSPIRLRSVFELLDMKHQLRQADRAHLIGAANWILLVKKGTDALPSTAAEVQALASSVRTVSKIPVIVGDHRLSVEIVTPKTDYVLSDEKWAVLDSRIAARLYQMFTVGASTKEGGRDDSLKLARVVARGMESRRHMMRRALERQIFHKIYEMNEGLTSVPKLNFHPRTIALDFDPAVASLLQDIRDRGDMSRETYLEQVDLDQITEARNRERERKLFDETFETQNPWGGTPSGGPPGQQAIPRAGTMGAGGRPMKPGAANKQQQVGAAPQLGTQSGRLLRPGVGADPSGVGQRKPGAQNPKSSGRAMGGRHNGGGAAGGQKGAGRSKTSQPKTTLKQTAKAELDEQD